MQQPFQCIAAIQRQNANNPLNGSYLLAACGTVLLSIDLSSGDIVCELPPKGTNNDQNEPPAKKQKIETEGSDTVAHGHIIKLSVSPDQRHAVVVTDDKCVRVLVIGQHGELNDLSTRCMPKRPCAIQVLPDNETILCGDKFGDVYSLPLLVKDTFYQEEDLNVSASAVAPVSPTVNGSKPWKPSATDKTVHTQRNLKSLAAQQNQKNLTPKTKEPPKFDHKLLLGHVSMLTDLTYATREVDGKRRGYIITADRDEHIRISRAPPQSHVIEGYCLGHKQFVSKVCTIPGTDMLVSGSGDDWLGVWEWPAFKLLRKIPLSIIKQRSPVSGLWVVPSDRGHILFVAQEKSPALSFLPVQDIMKSDLQGIQGMFRDHSSPILDLTFVGRTLVVSTDARKGAHQRLLTVHMDGLKKDEVLETRLASANTFVEIESNEGRLDGLLYGLANLRKRAHHDGDDNEDH